MIEDDTSTPLGRLTALVLAWIAEYGPATPAEVAHACDLEGNSARGRLNMLARQGLVEGRPNGAKPPRMAYSVTTEGRQAAGISDAQRPETA